MKNVVLMVVVAGPEIDRSTASIGFLGGSVRPQSTRPRNSSEIDTAFHRVKEEKRSTAMSEEQLTALRGGLTAEEYRWKLIREWGEA